MKRLLGAILVFATLQVRADTLGDVRVALKALTARHPVRATLTVEQSVKTAGRFANNQTERVANAEVSQSPSGVSILIPLAMLEKASQEQLSPTGGDGSAQDAIGSIRTLRVVEALNFRDSLLSMLANATVVEEKTSSFRGRSARLLVLALAPRQQKASAKIQLGTEKIDDRLNLWIGDRNIPIAAERIQKTTTGFMFLKASYSGRTSYTFLQTDDRLLLARMEVSEGGSGGGQKVEKTSIHTLTLLRPL